MTQRIFDIENEKDRADLWDILPESFDTIRRIDRWNIIFLTNGNEELRIPSRFIRIEWHNKTEITRPKQEATEKDVGKICCFWNDEDVYYGKLESIRTNMGKIYYALETHLFEAEYLHCRRLTKKEIEELI